MSSINIPRETLDELIQMAEYGIKIGQQRLASGRDLDGNSSYDADSHIIDLQRAWLFQVVRAVNDCDRIVHIDPIKPDSVDQ